MFHACKLFLRNFFAVLFCFVLHRYLSFEYLAPQGFQNSSRELMSYFFVGALSDVWVAVLVAWLAVAVASALRLWRPQWSDRGATIFVAVFLVLTALHQPYVEFFRFQFLPVHLQYFTDFNFISANAATAWTPGPTIVAVLSLAILCVLNYVSVPSGRLLILASAFIISAAGLGAHTANIYTRVQWFVPELLRTNYLENFYIAYGRSLNPPPLSEQELLTLASTFGVAPSQVADVEKLRAEIVLRPLPSDKEFLGIAQSMRKSLQTLRRADQKPIVLVLLMESLRPSESALYGGSRPSLTPHLDALAQKGVWFARAYSTGSVTRGGQEAVWCGYFSTQTNSAMRNRPDVTLNCLPDAIATEGLPIQTGWYHGGRGEFDGQQPFWAKHGVQRFLTEANFPVTTPRTGWGVSDLVLFDRLMDELRQFREQTIASTFLGMVLTVSNHIPWRLPVDAPADVLATVKDLTEPSHATAKYADTALGHLVEMLKAQGLWDESLLVLVSDHGHGAPRYQDKAIDRTDLYDSISHIHMMLSGGIAEDAAAKFPADVVAVRDQPVSQADVAPLLAYLMDIKQVRFFSDSLLWQRPRKSVVVADTGSGIYLPSSKQFYSYNELATTGAQLAPDDEGLRRYVNFLNYINNTRMLQGRSPHVE